MEKRDLRGSIWFNLFVIIVLAAILYVLFFTSLGVITRHGDEVKVPNVFTPNGDLDNEVFMPLMQGVVEYNMMIYNRWGELLFESNNQEIGWDGYDKGVLSPSGVYIYKLDLKFTNGERTSKFGDVTLLR